MRGYGCIEDELWVFERTVSAFADWGDDVFNYFLRSSDYTLAPFEDRDYTRVALYVADSIHAWEIANKLDYFTGETAGRRIGEEELHG